MKRIIMFLLTVILAINIFIVYKVEGNTKLVVESKQIQLDNEDNGGMRG